MACGVSFEPGPQGSGMGAGGCPLLSLLGSGSALANTPQEESVDSMQKGVSCSPKHWVSRMGQVVI